MIRYEVGDIFCSNADCLINTVNCEGYMGKGIAYQFKCRFPENNKDYVRACKTGKLYIGTLHFYREKGVTIINFPTKDKWREKSQMKYIEAGLERLIEVLPQLSVKTIAIPPLGCGNGGLNWQEVKLMIENKLYSVQDKYEFLIYEPSKIIAPEAKQIPKLGVSSLILMKMAMQLQRFNSLRLQKTAYFMNIFLKENYFNFQKNKYGPFSCSVAQESKNIREYQEYYNIQNTQETYRMVYQVLCSQKTDKKMEKLEFAMKRALNFVNTIEDDKSLEGIATVLFLVERSVKDLSKERIVELFKSWSKDKATRFSNEEIISYIFYLESKGIIECNILNFYQISEYL